MKRYSHAAYPNSHRLEENPTGEWIRWEDVGVTLKAILSRAETAEQANKALMDERAIIIRTHREQLERMRQERSEIIESSTLNFETLDIIFQHILTSDLVQDDDIGEGNTPEATAQAYIRVYDRLVEELRAAKQEITNLKDELGDAQESADRYREEAHHADMLRD